MSFKRVLCTISAGCLLLTGSGCAKNEETKEKNLSCNNYISELDTRSMNYTIGLIDPLEEVDNLNIHSDDRLPYNYYKVFRYVDNNQKENIRIVYTTLCFITNEDGTIDREYYVIRDIFTDELLISVYDIDFNSRFFEGEVYYVMNYGELLELKEIMKSKGLDEKYIDSVMSDDIKKMSLSKSEVGYMYVMLVNKNERCTNEYSLTK